MTDEPSPELILRQNIHRLLTQVGGESKCRGCDAAIWWVVHRNGKKAPYTADALNHFADCPAAAKFRKPKEAP